MQIATNGVVVNEYGHVLLIRRNDTRTMAPPGGSVEAGELPHESLAREVKEETGLLVLPVRLVGLYFWEAKPSGILVFVFRCIQRGGELTPSQESPEVGFFPSKTFPKPMLGMHRLRLDRAVSHAGGSVDLEVQQMTWQMRMGKTLINQLVYRYLDFRRFVRRETPYQQPPKWRVTATVMATNTAGEIGWLKQGDSGQFVLPSATPSYMEAPWEAAARIAGKRMGQVPVIKDLAAVYVDEGKATMELLFTTEPLPEPDGLLPADLTFCEPEQPPATALPRHAAHAAEARSSADETIFRYNLTE